MRPTPKTLRNVGRSIPVAVLEQVGKMTSRIQEESPLPADVLESDSAFRIVLDAPGATASDIQLEIVDGTLEVRIDRFRPFNEGFEMVFPGRGLELDGTVDLPSDTIQADAATATLKENGTLEVTIPKSETNSESEGGGADAESA